MLLTNIINQNDKLKAGGWTEVQPYVKMDLETTPLEIKTDSELGSKDRVRLYFCTSDSEEVRAGAVEIFFNAIPKYWIKHCMSKETEFSTSLPAGKDKIWRITKKRTAEDITVQIHCNDVEVVNLLMSDSTCNDTDKEWSKHWNRDVKKIRFTVADDASDEYRTSLKG